MNNPFYRPVPGFNRLTIFGAGGHGREIAWLVRQCWGKEVEIEFAVDRPEFLANEVDGIPLRLLDDCLPTPDGRFVVAVGDPVLRKKAARLCQSLGFCPALLVHPRVEASDSIILGPGSVVCAGTILTVNLDIGSHVHVNVNCSVSHDVVIGDFSTLSPGVCIAGNVTIGDGVFIGAGASVINGRSSDQLFIGEGAVIAAGACVTRSVAPGAMVAGVPAIRKR